MAEPRKVSIQITPFLPECLSKERVVKVVARVSAQAFSALLRREWSEGRLPDPEEGNVTVRCEVEGEYVRFWLEVGDVPAFVSEKRLAEMRQAHSECYQREV